MTNIKTWQERKKEKTIGYIIRFFAVIMWGIQPIYLKYTAVNRVPLDYRVFFTALGGVLTTFVILLLFYNDIVYGVEGSIKGDIFALILMSIDVVLVVAQIRYVKYLQENQSVFLNLYVYLFILIVMLPIILLNLSVFYSLTTEQIIFTIGAGVISGVGQILNYEAFRRMDGFIAFLMFNIAILLTFTIEAYWLKEIIITPFLIIGGVLIIGASIFAEVINSKCEKEEFE